MSGGVAVIKVGAGDRDRAQGEEAPRRGRPLGHPRGGRGGHRPRRRRGAASTRPGRSTTSSSRATRRPASRSCAARSRSRCATSASTPGWTARCWSRRSAASRPRSGNRNLGYDVIVGEYVDMVKAGIIDPAKVTRSAIENAASIAGMILTTEALITEVPEKSAAAAAADAGVLGSSWLQERPRLYRGVGPFLMSRATFRPSTICAVARPGRSWPRTPSSCPPVR